MPATPNSHEMLSVSTTNMRRTNRFCAPSARMVAISEVRSITEITSVFMMMITATAAITTTVPLNTACITAARRLNQPAAARQSTACAAMSRASK